jgi:glycogen(starch) synthase
LNLKVSLVIPTYKRQADLYECLRSVFDLKFHPYEVIVVDSNSMDGTEELKNSFPIRFVSIKERARERALNIGISLASGDIVAFLDDDVVVCKEWLDEIVEPYANGNVGGVGGRVIPYGRPKDFHVPIGRSDIGKVFSSGLVIGNFDIPLQRQIEVDSLIGCNMSFRRELLSKIGGFDENYAEYCYRDETDLCIRIRRLGYMLIYNSKAVVWHKNKGKNFSQEVRGKNSGQGSYWYVRNNVYFYFKNLFAQHKLGFPMFLYSMFMPPREYVLKSGIRMKVEPTLLLNIVKGFYDGYKTWRLYAS